MKEELKNKVIELLNVAEQSRQKFRESGNVTLDFINDPKSYNLPASSHVHDYLCLRVACALMPNLVAWYIDTLPNMLYPFLAAYMDELQKSLGVEVRLNDLDEIIDDWYWNNPAAVSDLYSDVNNDVNNFDNE